MLVAGIAEDRVTVDEIAERARVTTASVRYWIAGDRGPGGFPEPKVRRQRAALYSWAEVSGWLTAAKLGDVDHLAAETARACALLHAVLIVREGLRELPKHDRPLVARLVA
jgi:AcrR family transcriptional regulator